MDIAYQVREANKIIYNRLADRYEIIDGRRSGDLYLWIRKRGQEIASIAGKDGILLDIGCGAGFVARAVSGMFPRLYGIDISENILKSLSPYGILPICADAQKLPFKPQSINVAVLFSVVHHFCDYKPILNEICRILKPNGVVYIDHDMNRYFFRNFHLLINLYRRLSRKKRILESMNMGKLYSLSEFHSEGIDSVELKDYLISLGFRIINSYYHWYGLSKMTNLILKERKFSKNLAPLSGLIAQKLCT